MPNHATPVVVYGFILTRFDRTGNYLPKRTLLLLTAFPLRTAGMSEAFSPGKCAAPEKRWLLPGSSFLAGLAGNRGGEVWRGGTA